MRALVIVLGAALLATACGGAATPSQATTAPTVAATTAPTPAPTATAPTQLKFTADLKPENEVPPVSNEEKVASGKATIVFDLTRDATGKITTAKATADVTLGGFPATSQIVLMHIHGPNGAAGTNANPVIGFKTDSANPIATPAGTATFNKAVDVDDKGMAVLQQIIDTPANFYFNVHSKLNGGGAVRGQLTKG